MLGFNLLCSFYRILGNFTHFSKVEGYFSNHFRCLGHCGHLRGIWRKIWFCIPYKTHSGSNKHESISFMIDNMHYVIFRIWEQDSVPWCGEIQNKRLEVLGNTFNLQSNSTLRSRSVVFQSVSKGEQSSGFTRTYTPLHNNDSLKINFCMFLPFITNWLSNWVSLLGLSNWALVCGLEWNQKGPIKH